ncbi:tyrosine-type recombinase/integrase [Desulfotomaculum copahuensis]|uniref:Integrase n=1 Tax=Desulfotomaculum copahuensis TaxID=1838280 RepID=A0A1B7LG49_9FIRM|nr:tyrosine-type recombinase/integrase [Desulfotomaculum copahuensis]OAT83715.1 integrase [Desulfotomaculum copahuensis]
MLEKFQSYLRGKEVSDRTVRDYLAVLGRFARWVEQSYGEFDPAAVTPLDIADYRRQFVEKGRKPTTINHYLDILGVFFEWAQSEGLIQTNPATGIKKVSQQRQAPRWLDRRELGALTRAVQKYGSARDKALIALLLHTGLRISEAVVLRQEDIVTRERSGMVIVRQGKGGKYREVPLNVTVRRTLEEYLESVNGEWVFPNRRGGHITTRAVEKILSRFGVFSGVEITPHMLRHTFAKQLVDQGVSLDQVAVLAGHSNLNTTARYTRPSLHDLELAVDKLAWE